MESFSEFKTPQHRILCASFSNSPVVLRVEKDGKSDFNRRSTERETEGKTQDITAFGRNAIMRNYFNSSSSYMAQWPDIGPWPPVLQPSRHVMFHGDRLSTPRPTPKLEDQMSVFISPGDRVDQLYTWALGRSGPRQRHFPHSQSL
jgi:hypothetical protein